MKKTANETTPLVARYSNKTKAELLNYTSDDYFPSPVYAVTSSGRDVFMFLVGFPRRSTSAWSAFQSSS